MEILMHAVPMAAAGYSLVYLLAGGGLGGAVRHLYRGKVTK